MSVTDPLDAIGQNTDPLDSIGVTGHGDPLDSIGVSAPAPRGENLLQRGAHDIGIGFQKANQGFYNTVSAVPDLLDKGAFALHKATGMTYGGAFHSMSEALRRAGAQVGPSEEAQASHSTMADHILQELGGLPVNAGQVGAAAAAGPVGLGALGAAQNEQGGAGAMAAGALGNIMAGHVLGAATGMSPLARAGTGAAVFGGPALLRGDIPGAVEGGAAGFGLGALGKPEGTREITPGPGNENLPTGVGGILSRASKAVGAQDPYEGVRSDTRGVDAYNAFVKAESAPSYAKHVTNAQLGQLRSLGLSDTDWNLLGKWAEDQDAQALASKGSRGNVQRLGSEDAAALQTPKIQDAINVILQKIQPEVNKATEEAGVESRLPGPSGFYLRRIPQDEAGNTIRRTSGKSGSIDQVTPPSSHEFTGGAPGYSQDIPERALATNAGLQRSIKTNDLNAELQKLSSASVPIDENGYRPAEVEWGGKTVPVVDVPMRSAVPSDEGYVQTQESPNSIALPKPVADAYRNYVQSSNSDPSDIQKIGDVATRLYLNLGIQEPVRHATNILSVPMSLPGNSLAGKVSGFAQAWDVLRAPGQDPEAASKWVNDLAERGALRTVFSTSTDAPKSGVLGKISDVADAAKKIPGIQQVKESVFGNDEGKRGFETHLRVGTAMFINKLNPEMSVDDVSKVIRDMYGTSVQGLSSPLARGLRVADPFSKAFVALGKTGVRAAFGVDAATGQPNPAIAARNWSTVLGSLWAWNTATDPDHKDYFQQLRDGDLKIGDAWLPGDPASPGMIAARHTLGAAGIDTRTDSKGRVSFKLGDLLFASPLRGLRETGVKNAVEAMAKGPRGAQSDEDFQNHVGMELIRGIANTLMGRVAGSPYTQPVTNVLTGGGVPYFSQGRTSGRDKEKWGLYYPGGGNPSLGRGVTQAASNLVPSIGQQVNLLREEIGQGPQE